jgi:ABC-type sugar transport system permease subunit
LPIRAHRSVRPLLFSIWVSFVNYDFTVPGHAFIGLKNFSQVVFDGNARWSLIVTAILSFSRRHHRILSGPRFGVGHGQKFQGSRFDHVDPDHPAVH